MSVFLVLRIFIPLASGYFVTSLFRSISAIIAPDLVQDLNLTAIELGFSVSVFYICGALMQLPYGVLLDRYDPRKLYACFLFLSFLGTVIVSVAQDVVDLSIGRTLLTAGTTASAVTAYKVFSMWYSSDRLPMANGLALALGGLGMMAGTTPVEMALQNFDWRDIHLLIGMMILLCAILILSVTPQKVTTAKGIPLWEQIKGFKVILKSLVFWKVTPVLMAVMGVYGAFPPLWAGPWLRDVAEFNDFETANILFFMLGATTICYFLTGSITNVGKRVGLTSIGVAIATALLFTTVVIILFFQSTSSDSGLISSRPAIILMWILFGFLAPFSMLIYAGLSKEYPLEFNGRLNACLTLSWLLGMILAQNIYGWVLDQFLGTNGNFAIEGHQLGMGIMVLWLLVTLVWYSLFDWFSRKKAI